MKFGFWNRLAIVAIVLALIVGPIWIWLDMAMDASEAETARYELCLRASEFAFESTNDAVVSSKQRADCSEVLNASTGPGWAEWGWAVLGVFIACVVFYLLVWVLASSAKWVWRGREKSE